MGDTGVLDEIATAGAGMAGAATDTGSMGNAGAGTAGANDTAAASLPATDAGVPSDNAAGDTKAEGAADDKAKGYWPDDWRQKIAGEDAKKLKRLERYASPDAALEALFAAQAKISSGELKSVLKDNATPEELKAWREENGVPEVPDKYDLNLPSGIVIGEDDKPFVDDFLKTAHEANMHPKQVAAALDWYYAQQEKDIKEQLAVDATYAAKVDADLKKEWGFDYDRNIGLIRNLFESAPQGLYDMLATARMADGTPVGNHPDATRWFAQLAREANPLASILPGSGTNSMHAMENELADIQKMMGDRESDYWKGPKADRIQARYRELVETQHKLKK